jgi:peptidoglycan-associated lipoprotein
MRKISRTLLAAGQSSRITALFFCLFLAGCSASENRVAVPLMPADMQNLGREGAVRSISAMEALSRGVAAITPDGAALKDIYYEFDSTNLTITSEEILKQNATWMNANPSAKIEVEGHCDDIGSDEYNLALGAKRAQIAKDFLVSQGVSADRLVTISYGNEAPACFEQTEECRVKNRRARFIVFTELPTT